MVDRKKNAKEQRGLALESPNRPTHFRSETELLQMVADVLPLKHVPLFIGQGAKKWVLGSVSARRGGKALHQADSTLAVRLEFTRQG